jgi:EAL domain-containing protein (putative c-di-GMP-specific phosphodiesterase class I)
VLRILRDYHGRGFTTAIDDFGAGFAGLNLLAQFQPQVLKVDMELVRGIDASAVKQAIVQGVALIASRLGSRLVAEGVETRAELDCLRGLGIELFQGYLLAKPQVEALPEPDWTAVD